MKLNLFGSFNSFKLPARSGRSQMLVFFFFFQIICPLLGVEGFADVETHNLKEYKNS